MEHIFLSYSRKDLDIMRRVRDDLQHHGLPVWTDETLEPGTPIWEFEIANAIEKAACMLVLLTPESKKSIWVSREIGYAEGQDIRIFPFLVRGDDRSAIPFRLISSQWIDARRKYEESFMVLVQALNQHLEQRRTVKKDELDELPAEVREMMDDSSPFQRVAAVVELHRLLENASSQLTQAGRLALKRLMEDSKSWVAAAASECFSIYIEGSPDKAPIPDFEIDRLFNQVVDEAAFDTLMTNVVDSEVIVTASEKSLLSLQQATGAGLVQAELLELASKDDAILSLDELFRQQVDERQFEAIFADEITDDELPYVPQGEVISYKEAADSGYLDFN